MTTMYGRLLDTSEAPEAGERATTLVAMRSTTVEQILSSATPEPTVYEQDHDEWVVVLAGSATLDVDGQHHALGSGDWVLLRAGVPHRVLTTAAGTSWLAVHVGSDR
ncbi:MAG TPA: cupin domain-containing protein [Acidimicrobiia bacterium]|jgi:cupin 2 domain-containing protein